MEYPEDEFLSEDNRLDKLRLMLKERLPAIARKIEVALHEADLDYPLFISSPSSGRAIATIATHLDPDDSVWYQIDSIARQIIAEALGLAELHGTQLACAVANNKITVVDLAPNMVGSP